MFRSRDTSDMALLVVDFYLPDKIEYKDMKSFSFLEILWMANIAAPGGINLLICNGILQNGLVWTIIY